jgi:hypothetical protein
MPSDTPREKPRNVPRKVPRKRAGGPRPWQVIVIVAAVAVLAGIAIALVSYFTPPTDLDAVPPGGSSAAIEFYSRIIAKEPNNAEARYRLGRMEAVNGDLAAGIRSLEAALALRPDDARYADDLARAFVSAARDADAAALWERMAKWKGPPAAARVEYLLNAADSRMAAGDKTKAKANVKAALAISPSDPRALSLLKGLK